MGRVRLDVEIAGIKFKNPVLLASGTCGYGIDVAEIINLNSIGGVCLKGLSLKESKGNKPPRICETPSGMLNSIGLQNVGIKRFKKEIAPKLEVYNTKIIANFYGTTLDEYGKSAEALSDIPVVSALEMNISCPNIKEGGISFGTSPEMVFKVTKTAKKSSKKPLFVKLSPNVSSIAETAKAAEEGGADALSCINTIYGMAIDIAKRKFMLSSKKGGLSGPAIRPVALHMVYEAKMAVSIPIIGVGGIEKVSDAIEFILAGATAIQVGTALFYDPHSPLKIIKGIENYLKMNKFNSIRDIIGGVC